MGKNKENDKRQAQIFAGYLGGLILTEKGKLYAFGKNLHERFGENIQEDIEITAPVLLAEEVRHAAIGEHSVIYADASGKVKMTGNGMFAKNFQGFSNAKQVFCTWMGDGYIIKHEDDRLFGFGVNTPETFHMEWAGRFAPPEETCIYTFPPEKISLEPYQTGNVTKDEAEAEYGPYFIRKAADTETYHKLEREHGKINLKLQAEWKEDQMQMEISVLLRKIHIYQPVLYTQSEFAKSKCFYGCMYNKHDEDKIVYAKKVRKAVFIKEGMLVLHKDHSLAIWKDHAKTGIKYMEDVADISSAGDVVMILEKSGDILYGEKEKAKMLKWGRTQYHMERLKIY